jgi:HAD superfamily hydrolase (TIGR01544 family)
MKISFKDTFIVIDFDGTISKKKVNGEMVPSIISILRSEGHLSDEYTKQAYELETKYKPIEESHDISYENKYSAMEEWWDKHLDLLIKSGLHYNHIKSAAMSKKLVIREGVRELFEFCKINNVPVIIFSASGIGYEPIKLFLERENVMSDNIRILSNQFVWNEHGNVVSIVQPTIHSMNKTGKSIIISDIYKYVSNKKIALVIGDNIHDATMVDGLELDQVITYGIVHDMSDINLEKFRKTFDNIIIDGESLAVVLDVVN